MSELFNKLLCGHSDDDDDNAGDDADAHDADDDGVGG